MKYKVKLGEETFWAAVGGIVGGAAVAIAELLGVEVDESTSAIVVGAFAGVFGTVGRIIIGLILPTPEGE
jgi:uncharacterized membrane protein